MKIIVQLLHLTVFQFGAICSFIVILFDYKQNPIAKPIECLSGVLYVSFDQKYGNI